MRSLGVDLGEHPKVPMTVDEAKIRSSLEELEMAREARATVREDEERRMVDFIKQQDHTGGVLFSPNAVVTYDTLPDSPYGSDCAGGKSCIVRQESLASANRTAARNACGPHTCSPNGPEFLSAAIGSIQSVKIV